MKYFFSFLLFIIINAATAQTQNFQLAKEPAQFPASVKAMLATTRHEGSIQIGRQLDEIWEANRLSNGQKTKIISLAQIMLLKKLRPRPHFEQFLGAVVNGILRQNMSSTSLDQFLTTTDKSLQRDPIPVFEKFLLTSYSFLTDKTIYKSQLNSLRVLGGNFSFAYRDGSEPIIQKPVLPAPTKKPAKKKPVKDGEVVWNDSFVDEPLKPVKSAKQTRTASKNINPAAMGAVIQLQGVDLSLSIGQDSVTIKKSDGVVVVAQGNYVGDKGLFTWTTSHGEASAVLKKFNFGVDKPDLKAEGVTFTYPAALEAPVEGVLEFRNNKQKTNNDSDYPKFTSNTNNARLKNIGENIQYVGGFTLAGNKTSTAALDGSPSNITVSLNGKPKFKASAANYAISDTLISSDLAAITIYQNKDSLYHPGIRFKYSKQNKTLYLTRNEQTQASAFSSSYYQVEMNADMLTWNLNTPQINFSILSAKNHVPVRLTSKEFFTEGHYEQLRGSADFHPLILISNFATKRRTNSFFLHELAQNSKIKENELATAAAMLARQNFLDYNSTTGEVSLKPKAIHFMQSAQGKKDYDYLTMRSLMPSGKNATLDLNKNELLVRGVDRFNLTGDSVAVYAVPDSSQVRILRNRDIKFNGVVVASLFRFRGSNFTFNYNEFLINMAKIDTIAFAIEKNQKKGTKDNTRSEQYLANDFHKTKGVLYLNKANNKSGRKKYANYPMFDATAGAYVYFNKPQILGGAYDSTVYFAIPPFKLDSLGGVTANTVGFKGTFYSGGIFPSFETKLVLMPDKSLGFEYTLPKSGLPAYGGKGKFYKKLTMSYKGLQGNGEINYLTTKLQSNAFTFYQDKVLTLGTKATVAESTVGEAYFMQANFDKYALEWLPRKDTMNISTTTKPIKLYQNKFSYRGIATITPKGFFGDGTIEGVDGSIKSPLLQFAKTKFKANNATLEIKSKTPGKPAIRASDVLLEYDLKAGVASFSPEKAGVASTDFPHAQFRTSLSGGKWNINKKLVTMNEPVGSEAARAFFVSTRPSHEGLKFKARSANYDISRNTLNIGGVPYIASADAHIIPDSSRVYVTADSQLKAFHNAKVISDTLNQYHHMTKSKVEVISRLKFQGSGMVKYVNALSDTFGVNFNKFTMKNMDKFKLATKSETKEGNLVASIDTNKLTEITTDVLGGNTAGVATTAPAKKGLFRKRSNKKKVQVQGNSEKIADTPEPDLGAEPTVAEKKTKKKRLVNRKSEVIDSIAVAFDAELPEKKEKRRFKKEEVVNESAIPADAAYTAGVATIKETDNFVMAPGVLYKGEITMNSIRPHWDFNGFVKLSFSDKEAASDWFPYKATVNPAEVKINIEKPVAADETPLKTGLHIAAADNKIYNTFVSKKKDETDLDVFDVEGQLSYIKSKKEFRLGQETRVSGENYEGNLLIYNDSLQISQYEGKFNLIRPTKDFNLSASGTALAKPADKLFTLDAFLAFDLDLPDQALTAMGKEVADNTSGAPEAISDPNTLPYKIAQFIGNKEAQAYAAKSGYVPLANLNSKLLKSLVFNAVQLRWSDSTKAWFSKGKLSLSHIDKKDINAQIPGYIEIKRGTDADMVNIYLEPAPSVWYYFMYDGSVLTAASSDNTFNNNVAKKRSNTLVAGEAMDKAQFVNSFRKAYLKDYKEEVVAPVEEKETPEQNGNFDFMEDDGADSKKRKKKSKAATVETETPKAEKETKEKPAKEPALPGMTEEPKKKKKTKKEKDEGLLPDVDLN